MKQQINLIQSVDLDDHYGKINPLGADAPHEAFNGIEREGGLMNIGEERIDFSTGSNLVTEDEKVLNFDNGNVSINGSKIASLSSFGIEKNTLFTGYDDLVLTADGKVLGANITFQSVKVTELDYDGNVLRQRETVFTALPLAFQYFTSISFVRFDGITYNSTLEFLLRLGDTVIVMNESTPGQSLEKSFISADVLGTNNVNVVLQYGPYLVVAGDGGRVGSYDGNAWKNYDGSGQGTGPWNNGTAIGTNNILSAAVYNNSLVIGGVGGRIASFDGTTWNNYNKAGTGLWNNATAILTDNVTAMVVYRTFLVVGGHLGKLGSFNGTAWTNYNVAGLSDNATLIGAVSINTIIIYNDGIVVAGASGRLGSARLVGGITWTFTTTTAPGSNWISVAYGNGRWVAVAETTSTTAGIAYSDDNGVTWTFTTLPSAPGGGFGWISVAYGNGRWVAVAWTASTTDGIAYSDNGINWTFTTTPAPGSRWSSVAYGNGRWVAVAGTTSTTAGIAYSDNGINWTFTTTTAPGSNWISVAYGNGRWVAVARTTSTTAGIAYSDDNGVTWTFTTLPSAPGAGWRGVAYGSGRWVAVAETTSTTAGIAYSDDNGVTWTFTTTTAPGFNWGSVAYGNGRWVAVSQTTSTTAGIAYSDNGINWTFTTTTAPLGNGWYSVAYGNGRWVAVARTSSTTAGIAYSNETTFNKRIYTASSILNTYPTNNGTVIGANSINTMAVFNDNLVVGGVGGRIGSYNVNFNITTIINTQTTINNYITNFNNNLRVQGSPVTDINNTGLYPGSTTYTGLYTITEFKAIITELSNRMNSVSVSGNPVDVATRIDPLLLFPSTTDNPLFYTVNEFTTILQNLNTAVNGFTILGFPVTPLSISITSGDGIGWYNYNFNFPLTDDGTIIGTNDIKSLLTYNTNNLVVAGVGGRIGSFVKNGSSYDKVLYTDSSGIRSNATAVGSNNINSLTLYDDKMLIGSNSSNVGAMFSDYTFAQFWVGTSNKANLLSGFSSFNYSYCWRYDTGNYLLNVVGNDNNESYVFRNDNRSYIAIKGRFAWPQKLNGLVRHIITHNPVYDANKIESIGLQGYTDFTTYTNSIVYPSAAIASITGVPKKNIGWAATEHTYTVGANIFNWTPEYKPVAGSLYQTTQSNTDTLINAYSKLTNNVGVIPGVPFEIRLNWLEGVQAYLSVARLGGSSDNLGVIITGIGEFDDTYTPQIEQDSVIMYRYNANFNIIKIGQDIPKRFQQIEGKLYKINTISPFNIIDTEREVMAIGSADYNGRMLYQNTAAVASQAIPVNSKFDRLYSNSIDAGSKLVTIATPSQNEISVFGIGIIDTGSFIERFSVDTYVNDQYSFTTLPDRSETINSFKENTLYLENDKFPLPIGVQYGTNTAKTLDATFILADEYDGYIFGNSIQGDYTYFNLSGQDYLFDGKKIYAITLNDGVYQNKIQVCDALGLRYVASSPTTVYFLSIFDNSLYVYNGGRTIEKGMRLTQLDAIDSGVYSTRDNTLFLSSPTKFAIMRDDIWSVMDKDDDQVETSLYITNAGVYVANNISAWKYPFIADEYKPFKWQSAFFGQTNNQKSICSNIYYTIYNREKENTQIKLSYFYRDEDIEDVQEEIIDINSSDYTSNGYLRLRLQPIVQRSLGFSVGIECEDKILLSDVTVEVADDVNAGTSDSKTR